MEISSPRELIAAIPHLLGFVPEESLVIVALTDNDVSSVVRVDWPTSEAVVSGSLSRYAQSIHDYDIVFCFYVDNEIQEFDSIKALFHNSELLDVLAVNRGRWTSLMCTDESCCPREGRLVHSETPVVAAEFVFKGSSPFASRDELAQSIAPMSLSASDKQECETAFAAMSTVDDVVAEIDWVMEISSHGKPLTWNETARLSLALSEIRVRDALLRRAFESFNVRMHLRSLLMSTISRIPEAHVAPAATLLAGVVWLDGNGPLARIALDRALEADSEYSLAQLLDTALTHAVPSRIWSESLEAVSYEDCLQGAA
jgi:hypothetical protein